ncbi:MAG: RNA polymerase sigma-70 factor [Chloroflexi bacterium]|nr:RNA polymerase sigma-70 factor [Ardenticatenaceae bacterium]MBL1129843.1 RNA polymerase sigma-70 factor [Chloroflexota bacterium]NOG35928.1 RNA polymerase sigma-70 factor [Chloroflexota bacterium]GIK56233.1 MAG: DNA-directed RNA polymerase sigma-70 factor [Chloroflexota bacterium]
MQQTDTFNSYRAYLFAIAYRMLGSVMDAEDMVQETYLRWQNSAAAAIESPKSYLAAIITRLCIDHLRSAKVQRETYMGEWLPEPLLLDSMPAQEDMAALSDTLSIAFLVLLETLSPTERAVFLLREVFDYEYAEIAEMVGKSEANCRQMVRRARQHLADGRPRFQSTPAEQQHIVYQFAQACVQGDMTGLLALLAEDVVEYSDGGGKVVAAIKPVHGAEKVARFFLGLMKKLPDTLAYQLAIANGRPAILSYLDGEPINVTILDIGDGRIQRIYNIVNPDKLRHLKRLGD